MHRASALFVLLLATSPLAAAQAGDREGEDQPPLPEGLVVPPAPALTPAEQARTFALPPGYRIELVAAEPLVVDPVVARFDAAGRLWVVEMRGYMPDIDGVGETEPIGEIAVLRDADGDGRMDERSVFLDELVLPRAVLPFEDGALVIAPPDLLFCRDTDGDGRADEREVIETGLGGIHSPEHAINGLTLGIDGWVECASWNVRYRRRDGAWERERTAGGGQWGLTRDDEGRLFFNTNPDPLRGDLYPSHYAVRNANHGAAGGVNVRVAHGAVPHPARMTPGVNRGYRAGVLGEDWRLATYTAACSPLIFRGDAVPGAGDAFVCEPAGNLVARFRIAEDDRGGLDAVNARPRGDFLTSTDERFRPVDLTSGPDGALYVVDLYRGVIQHRLFVTTFLRRQVVARGLEVPVGLGRVWRVVHESAKARRRVDLESATWDELGEALADPNGWRRDTAQQLFVEEGRDSKDALEVLREAVRGESALGRLHATWALAALGRVDRELALELLRDDDERVRRAAIRAAEPLLATSSGEAATVAKRIADAPRDSRTRLQAIHTLGGVPWLEGLALARVLEWRDEGLVDALLTGTAGRELSVARRALEGSDSKARTRLLRLLSRSAGRSGATRPVSEALELALDLRTSDPDAAAAMARGLLDARPAGADGEPSTIAVASRPAALARLTELPAAAARPWTELSEAFDWPGRPGSTYRALTADEERRFERGRVVYTNLCSSCHQPDGRGAEGQAPPLRASPWALGPPERPIRIVLHGMSGPIDVGGRTFDLDMPGQTISDDDLAAVLTYVRREWGNRADPVDAATVATIRERDAGRTTPWTAAELTDAD